jgi:hypothetical protein
MEVPLSTYSPPGWSIFEHYDCISSEFSGDNRLIFSLRFGVGPGCYFSSIPTFQIVLLPAFQGQPSNSKLIEAGGRLAEKLSINQ